MRIRREGVDYELAYWNGATRYTAWCTEDEFKPRRGPRQRIGFKNEEV